MNIETFEMYRRPDFVLVPELESLGQFITAESRLGGARQDGSIGMELGYLEKGSVEWWDGGHLQEAAPHSVLIDQPGDWQGGASAIVHPCHRYWLRFRFPNEGALPGLTEETTLALAQAFRAIKVHHFPGSPALRDLFVGLLEQQRDPARFSEEYSRALFHQILILMLRDYERNQQKQVSSTTRRAVAYLSANVEREVHVDEVSKLVQLSTGYFHELFHKETGMPPARYHQRLRITAAKHMLIEHDLTITDVAMNLGFSSSQYFSTIFKKVVGLTPQRYRSLRSKVSNPR
ncbi:AraC family transcriptional regulator [Devosia sp. Root685]|uniref:AraC family transcriptional regulator n=1 Tax=Devosia sp. Root685 TaxID=1736587 RepID=UPI000B0F7875|nr:AraC family transcriptional regulator [Devosia sp. Root685]